MSIYCNYWNKVSLVKSKIKKSKKIDSIGIGLASPEEIRRWGERRLPNGTIIGKVDKDHTVDYESLKPIEGGLFCERIFGPVEDFYCSCERKGEKNEKFCPNCEVEFTKSRVRRIRMGYIPLAVPVVHVWYLRGRPSYIANLVGKSRNSIDRLAYGETLSESFIGILDAYSATQALSRILAKRETSQRILAERGGVQRSATTSIWSEDREQSVWASDSHPPGSSSLESLYKKEKILFPKNLHSAQDLRTSSSTSSSVKQEALGPTPFRILAKRERVLYALGRSPFRVLVAKRWDVPRMLVAKRQTLSRFANMRGRSDAALRFATSMRGKSDARRRVLGILAAKRWDVPRFASMRGGVQRSATTSMYRTHKKSSNAYVKDPHLTEGVSKEGVKLDKEQKYIKFHTLPLFSTFVYKEWSHRFSFLEYFIWSARNNDLVLPFYSYQNTPPEKRLANICESIRKSSLNLIKNKFSLRFSKGSNFPLNSLIGESPHIMGSSYSKRLWGHVFTSSSSSLPLSSLHTYALGRPPFCVLVAKRQTPQRFADLPLWGTRSKEGSSNAALRERVLLTPEEYSCAASNPPPFTPSARCGSFTYAQRSDTNRRFQRNPSFVRGVNGGRGNLLLLGSGASELKISLCSRRVAKRWVTGTQKKESIYVFSTMQQNAESTPLNKIDTQQFPRLTELLNFTGGAALRNLLSRFDLIVLSKFLRHELKNLELKVNSLLALKMLTYSQGLLLGKLAKRRSKQIRRLKLLELFQSQKSNPEWMILSVIPVLPPDLRPILRVNDDFVVASDLNRLYQTVLRRNNTIHERLDDPLPCPESGLFRQRSLQKAIDGLLENGKGGGTPLCASKRRPLVSLSHVLKGKKGLFRQHLLGKRVDYSGRSVIVVGPRLQVHECGLPKEMAIELFQPFLLHRLKVKGLATSNTAARRMIQQENPVIWHILKQLVYEHPVLLNRAPTLHRLGIQAFQPRLVSGRAILLHPLVCNGFNADFDGDQMAVHVPLSFQARAEAWKIMWSKNNFLSPATGQPILVPSQDMVLGCYYLSVSIPRILNANVSVLSHELQNEGLAQRLSFQRNPSIRIINESNGVSIAQQQLRKSLPISHVSGRTSDASCFTPPSTTESEVVEGPGWGVQRILAERGGVQRILAERGGVQRSATTTTTCQIVSQAFLNENKGQYFSNLQDSLLAYFQGRLQTHTPFWVRIDPAPFQGTETPAPLHRYASTETPAHLQRILVAKRLDVPRSAYPEGSLMRGEVRRIKDPSLLRVPHRVPYAERGRSDARRRVLGILAERGGVQRSATTTTSTETRGGGVEFSTNSLETVQLVNKPNIDKGPSLITNGVVELSFLQPLYGSSREIYKTFFQTKSTNRFQFRVEANETLESPLELRLNVDGNLTNILTTCQNHYNYNATWVKQCKEESIKYMRTTAGRVVINKAVFKDF